MLRRSTAAAQVELAVAAQVSCRSLGLRAQAAIHDSQPRNRDTECNGWPRLRTHECNRVCRRVCGLSYMQEARAPPFSFQNLPIFIFLNCYRTHCAPYGSSSRHIAKFVCDTLRKLDKFGDFLSTLNLWRRRPPNTRPNPRPRSDHPRQGLR